ncbi:MAG: O-antigen ligase family protein [Acidobacteria bacterium]|nr:O-antigen ligase family protein [Acidobacteriota bacterium]
MTTSFATMTEACRERPDEISAFTGGVSIAVARRLLIAGLMVAPLALGAVVAWAWAGLAFLAAALLILWGMEQVKHRRVRIVWSPLYGILMLLAFGAAVQFYAGLNSDRIAAREALIKIATDFLLFFLAAQLFSNAPKSVWRGVVAAVTVFAFALSLLAILQNLSGGSRIFWVFETSTGFSFGPYVNRNHFAGLMEMLLPLGIAGLLGRRGRSPFRGFLVFGLVVAVASLLLSGSRGGTIAFLVEMLIWGVLLVAFSARGRTRAVGASVAVGLASSAALFFVIDPGQASQRLATIAAIPTQPEAALADRGIVSRDALRIYAEHPWTGIGLGSFAVVYPRYQSFPSDKLWEHAHNDYAEALVETGTVGAALIVAALASFYYLAFARVRERLEREIGWIQMGAAIGCCGLLVHSLVDFNLHIPANAAWFAVSAAIATTTTDSLMKPVAASRVLSRAN